MEGTTPTTAESVRSLELVIAQHAIAILRTKADLAKLQLRLLFLNGSLLFLKLSKLVRQFVDDTIVWRPGAVLIGGTAMAGVGLAGLSSPVLGVIGGILGWVAMVFIVLYPSDVKGAENTARLNNELEELELKVPELVARQQNLKSVWQSDSARLRNLRLALKGRDEKDSETEVRESDNRSLFAGRGQQEMKPTGTSLDLFGVLMRLMQFSFGVLAIIISVPFILLAIFGEGVSVWFTGVLALFFGSIGLKWIAGSFGSAGSKSATHRKDFINERWKWMRGVEFEAFLEVVFRELGYDVETTSTTGDQGVDLIVIYRHKRIAIQVKGWAGNVGNGAVQEAYSGMAHYNCDAAAVITNSRFTKKAIELANSTGCTLIDGDSLPNLILGKIDLWSMCFGEGN